MKLISTSLPVLLMCGCMPAALFAATPETSASPDAAAASSADGGPALGEITVTAQKRKTGRRRRRSRSRR